MRTQAVGVTALCMWLNVHDEALELCSTDEWHAVMDLYRRAQAVRWRPFTVTQKALSNRWNMTSKRAASILHRLHHAGLMKYIERGGRGLPTTIQVMGPDETITSPVFEPIETKLPSRIAPIPRRLSIGRTLDPKTPPPAQRRRSGPTATSDIKAMFTPPPEQLSPAPPVRDSLLPEDSNLKELVAAKRASARKKQTLVPDMNLDELMNAADAASPEPLERDSRTLVPDMNLDQLMDAADAASPEPPERDSRTLVPDMNLDQLMDAADAAADPTDTQTLLPEQFSPNERVIRGGQVLVVLVKSAFSTATRIAKRNDFEVEWGDNRKWRSVLAESIPAAIVVPGTDTGWKVMAMIDAEPHLNNVPVIMLTSDKLQRDKAKAANVHVILEPPVSARRLGDAINKALNR